MLLGSSGFISLNSLQAESSFWNSHLIANALLFSQFALTSNIGISEQSHSLGSLMHIVICSTIFWPASSCFFFTSLSILSLNHGRAFSWLHLGSFNIKS